MTQTKTRPRSPSPASPIKRLRTDASEPVTSRFASGLLDERHAQRLHTEYAQSEPYKHIVIEQLFDDALLRGVKDEILGNIQFTEKETDIYKVHDRYYFAVRVAFEHLSFPRSTKREIWLRSPT